MRSDTGAETAPGADPAEPAEPDTHRTRLLGWLAVIGVSSSILIMIATSVVRDSWMYPPIVLPAGGAPWDLQSGHISAGVATVALWIALVAGMGGVMAGLVAVQRGARPSLRALLIAAAIAVIALTVLPPAGSTDAFDYASYGRILALGHSPYVMTPYHLRLMHNAFSRSVPTTWQHYVSVYGPLATLEQFLAAKLGGMNAARIAFWIKLWNSLAFVIIAVIMDRMLRGDPARRLRAHLLWTINPLLLWVVVASGHLDVLAAAAGLAGLLVLGEQANAGDRPSLGRVVAAGALIGVSADIKINYVLFGLGLAWALRRSLTLLAASAGAALAVLVPSYAAFGTPAIHALAARRNGTSADSFYNAFLIEALKRHIGLIAVVLVVAVAVLAFRRMPDGLASRPAAQAALVLSVAWLFFWPYQFPWYDTMIICLLVFYPASRLDWLVLARIAAGAIPNTPGNPGNPPGHIVAYLHHFSIRVAAPMVLLAAAVGLVLLCVYGRWKMARTDGPPGAAAGAAALVPSATS
jgi:hypothetical protein